MHRSEYSANLELQPTAVPAWQQAGKGHRVARKRNSYVGAVVIGVIMAIPFIVEIFKHA